MTLPTNPQAEDALISRLLVDPSQLAGIVGVLKAEDFQIKDRRDAFEAMIGLWSEGRPVDVLTIQEATGRDDLELPTPDFEGIYRAPIEEYVEVLRGVSTRRRVVQTAKDLIAAARSGDQEAMSTLAGNIEDLVAAARRSGLGLVSLEEFQLAPPPPMLGMLSPEGTTVLYGEGGDGKGWIASSMIRDLLHQDIKTLILDFENHPTEWAYRLNRLGVPLRKVVYVEPQGTMDKWADARAERLMKSEDIGFIVVDSATYATNDSDDPYSPRAAMLYKRARAKLGNLPTLLLAHMPKGSDTIFGSVFFRNEARIVWRLLKVGEERQRQLECKKDNVYGLEGKRFIVEFDEPEGVLNLHPWGQPWQPQKVASGA